MPSSVEVSPDLRAMSRHSRTVATKDDENAFAAILDRRKPQRRQGRWRNAFQIEFALLVSADRLEAGEADLGHDFPHTVHEDYPIHRLEMTIAGIPCGPRKSLGKEIAIGPVLPAGACRDVQHLELNLLDRQIDCAAA